MALYASVVGGIVRELWTAPSASLTVEVSGDGASGGGRSAAITPADCFPAGTGAGQAGSFVACGDDVRAGWTFDGSAFAAPALTAVVPPVREASSYDLVSVLTGDQVAALATVKAKDQHLFGKRNGTWPENNPKIARIATALDTTPAAWFDAALGAS